MKENMTVVQRVLTDVLHDMIEGEDESILEDYVNMFYYHAAYAAGIVSGNETFLEIIGREELE